MRETEFYQRHVKKMSGILHLERIENAVGTGFPDVSAAGGGKQFLVETKVSKPADGQEYLYFERFQMPFYKKRLRYTEGKGIFVLALCDGDTRIIAWEAGRVLDAKSEPYKKWNRIKVSNILNPLLVLQKPWPVEVMRSLAEKLILHS